MKFQIDSDQVLKLPYQRGVITSYLPKMCDVVVSTAQSGGDEEQMCLNCGIGMQSFRKYQKDHPEFAQAVEYAKLLYVASLQALMVAGASGLVEHYNFKANEKLLEVAAEKYRKLAERNQINNTVNINTINLTPQQRIEKIQQISEKLKSFGIEYDNSQNENEPNKIINDSQGVVIDAE